MIWIKGIVHLILVLIIIIQKNLLPASAAGTVVFSAHFMVCCLISCISYNCILLKKGHLKQECDCSKLEKFGYTMQ